MTEQERQAAVAQYESLVVEQQQAERDLRNLHKALVLEQEMLEQELRDRNAKK